MSTLIANIICSTLNTIVGFFVIKKLAGSNQKLNNFKNISLLLILIVIPYFMHDTQYSGMFSLLTCIISIIIYKFVFEKKLLSSIVLVTVMFMLMSIADIVTVLLFLIFHVDIELFRTVWYFQLIANITVFSFTLILANISFINRKLKVFITKLENNKKLNTIIFLILIVIVIFSLLYNEATMYGWNGSYMINFIIMVIFIVLFAIFINEKNSYYDLMNDYNGLFDFVQDFEDQIEQEQFRNHEYNNQLAVLMSVSTEPAVIDQIKTMISQGASIEGEWVKGLKSIPKSGLKGLLFYKLSIAKKNNVSVTIDISKKVTKCMKDLNEKELKVLCNLVGVYFDNAIEAAKSTKEKNVTLEIYLNKEMVNIVITNSISNKVDLNMINKKGFSSKGANRGKGLHFAKKIIDKNSNWLSGEQKVIDDSYYVQKICIKKENTEN